VTADRYVEMLETFLRPKLDDVDTARRSLGVLRDVFWAFDLSKGRRGVAGTVTRFKHVTFSFGDT
jgi:hypothetical protein